MLPEDTIYTPTGELEHNQEKLKDCKPPRTSNRIRPFIVFLKRQKTDAIKRGDAGEEFVEKRPFVFDLSTQGDAAMVRHYVINKKWPILAYRLVEEYQVAGQREETWDGKPALQSLAPEIEALAHGGAEALMQLKEEQARDKQEISSLRKQLEELEAKGKSERKTKATNSATKQIAEPV